VAAQPLRVYGRDAPRVLRDTNPLSCRIGCRVFISRSGRLGNLLSDSMLPDPLAYSVAAVVIMIEIAIRFENAMPASVSARIRVKANGACHQA
jgi:hypothetical protein